MRSWKKPTPEQVDKAVALLAHGENHRYFFDRLENPEWLVALKAKGFFSSPPSPIRDESRGTVAFPLWPESRYLARMAKFAPKNVVEILLQIPSTENGRVYDDLADAALAIPADLAARLVPNAISWIQTPFQLLLPKKLGALVSHLTMGGEIGASLDLARALLAVRADPRRSQKASEENRFLFPEPQPLFALWDYEQVLQKIVPDLVAAAEERALTLLCDLLDEAVRLSRRGDENQEPEDYSYIWRSAIDRGQSTDHDVRGLLVAAARDAAEQIAQQNPSKVAEVIRNLENRKWHVFHRLALHVLRVFAQAAPGFVAERLREPERFDKPDFRREYNLLARECFGGLRPEDQGRVLGWIQKGPDVESLKVRWTKFTGKPVTDKEAARYLKEWQRDRLSPFNADLPEDWKQRYAQLVAEVGPPGDLTRARTITGGVFTPKSPKTSEDLRKMTVQELVDYLRYWVPSGELMGESIAGLSGQLAALVGSEPERFAAEAQRFKSLDPTYIRELLQGFWEPTKQKRTFNWEEVLALCLWVMDQPRENPGRKGGLLDQDPDWGWTRKSMASLLSYGFDSDVIPFELRYRAWGVLERLADDSDPTPEDDFRYGENMDLASFSINTTRGEAMHAVVRYSLWVRRRMEKEPDGKTRAARGFDEMPEVRTVFDKHLDPDQEPSLAIRIVFGQWLPWLHFLDQNWATANIPKIFPLVDNLKDFRDVAWDTYIVFCEPYNNVFEILKEEYGRAIEMIGTLSKRRTHLGDPDSRLAEHLISQYWRGKLDADVPKGLLARFYAKADPKLRNWALEFIGRGLWKTAGNISPEILDRVKHLWATRLEAVRAAGTASPESGEVTSFGWWFVSGRFDAEWAIDQLLEALKIGSRIEPDHLVVERLAQLSGEMPIRTVECLRMIVEGDRDGWGILGWRDHARTILGTAIHSADLTARDRTIDLVHRLGSRGYFEFRDLLPSAEAQ